MTPIDNRIQIQAVKGVTIVDCLNVVRVSYEELQCDYPQEGSGATGFKVQVTVAEQVSNTKPLAYCEDVVMETKFGLSLNIYSTRTVSIEEGATVSYTAELMTALASSTGAVTIQTSIVSGEDFCTLTAPMGDVERKQEDYNTKFSISVATSEADGNEMKQCTVKHMIVSEDPCYKHAASTFSKTFEITMTPKVCFCNNGVAATNAQCPSSNAEMCKSCHRAYRLETKSSGSGGTNSVQVCVPCEVGKFGLSAGVCTNCDAGRYEDSTGSLMCKECAKGQSQEQEEGTKCNPCGTGTFANKTSLQQCYDCPQGYYVNDLGSASCFSCIPGTFQNEMKKSSCKKCQVGQFRTSNDASSHCLPCARGRYQNIEEQATCLPCIPGAYNDEKGRVECKLCDPSTFTDDIAQHSCKNCLPGEKSIKGSAKCQKCESGEAGTGVNGDCEQCAAGQYRNSTMNSTTCAACPTGWTSVGGSSRCQSVSFVFPVLLLV